MEMEEIWQASESLLEEETGCSMRDLREKREIIEELKDKFSTKVVLGEDCFEQVTSHIEEERPTNSALSELCIRRQKVISDLTSVVVKDKTLKLDLQKAEKLWTIISNEILPMEVFWSMEYLEDNDYEFEDEENEILSYMRSIADLYLDQTYDLALFAAEREAAKGL